MERASSSSSGLISCTSTARLMCGRCSVSAVWISSSVVRSAAGQPAHRRLGGGGDDLQIPDYLLGVGPPGFPIHKDALGLAVIFQNHIVRNGQGGGQTHAQPVLGDEGQGDADLSDLQRVLADELLSRPIHGHVLPGDGLIGGGGVVEDVAAALDALEPGDGLQQLLLPAAGDAGNAQNFPADSTPKRYERMKLNIGIKLSCYHKKA